MRLALKDRAVAEATAGLNLEAGCEAPMGIEWGNGSVLSFERAGRKQCQDRRIESMNSSF